MRTSLQTALRAGSMVSPARRMDTPVICESESKSEMKTQSDSRRPEGPPGSQQSQHSGDGHRSPLCLCNCGPRTHGLVGSGSYTAVAKDQRAMLHPGRIHTHITCVFMFLHVTAVGNDSGAQRRPTWEGRKVSACSMRSRISLLE